MRVVGVIFVLVAITLAYTDSFSEIFAPAHGLPTFSFFLPRIIDFLFYGGLILTTLSVVQAQREERKSKGIIVEQQENSVGIVDSPRAEYPAT